MKNADERLLAAGNFTRCETIGVLKKAAHDYRKKMEIDESTFMAVRIYRSVYRQLDRESKEIRGNYESFRENLIISIYSSFALKDMYR